MARKKDSTNAATDDYNSPDFEEAVAEEPRKSKAEANDTVVDLPAVPMTGALDELVSDDERLLEVIATGVAHSFNNVTASIRAALQVARERLGPDCLPTEVRSIDMVLARGTTLTRSLLTMAHARRSRSRALYLLDVVEDTLELLEAGLLLENVTISRCYSRAPVIQAPLAVVQRTVLKAVLYAAGTISPVYREIRVGFGRGTNRPYLELSWTRSPEAPSSRDAILSDLAPLIAQIETVNGAIEIQTGSHHGTSLQLSFPIATADIREPERKRVEGALPPRPLNVLIIDDEEVLRRMMASYLTLHGIQVHTAEDGPRGLEMAESKTFDVVLLDLVMPGLPGEQVLRQLKDVRPDLPVIVLSGLLDDTISDELMAQGAFGLISKPLQLDRLLWMCRDAVRTCHGAPPEAPVST